MIRMNNQVKCLLEQLFVSYLLAVQKKKNPLKSPDDTDRIFDSLVKKCQPVETVFNRRKFRALIALGIIKPSKVVDKNDYHIKVSLTNFGIQMCEKLLFNFDKGNFERALMANPKNIFSSPLGIFWDGVNIDYDVDSKVSFKYPSLDDFETWILKYPHIKTIIPFINNRIKTEKVIHAIYDYVYARPMDYCIDDDDDI